MTISKATKSIGYCKKTMEKVVDLFAGLKTDLCSIRVADENAVSKTFQFDAHLRIQHLPDLWPKGSSEEFVGGFGLGQLAK